MRRSTCYWNNNQVLGATSNVSFAVKPFQMCFEHSGGIETERKDGTNTYITFRHYQMQGSKPQLCQHLQNKKYQLYLTAVHMTIFNVHGSVHRNNILIYIQQDATLHILLYLETALHVSGGTSTHHQERCR